MQIPWELVNRCDLRKVLARSPLELCGSKSLVHLARLHLSDTEVP